MRPLQSLLNQASNFAETAFGADGLMPRIIAEASEGGLAVYAVAAGGPQLDQMRAMVEDRLKHDGTVRWVFFSQAWVVQFAKGKCPQGEPKDHPERIDAISFDARDRRGNVRTGYRQVLRIGEFTRILPMVMSTGPARYAPSIVEERGP